MLENFKQELGVVVYTFNPSSQEIGEGRALHSKFLDSHGYIDTASKIKIKFFKQNWGDGTVGTFCVIQA